MSSPNLPAQRFRVKTDPEPSLPSLDLHVPKRRKTITAMDSSDEYNTFQGNGKPQGKLSRQRMRFTLGFYLRRRSKIHVDTLAGNFQKARYQDPCLNRIPSAKRWSERTHESDCRDRITPLRDVAIGWSMDRYYPLESKLSQQLSGSE